jgi:hypothetical protein
VLAAPSTQLGNTPEHALDVRHGLRHLNDLPSQLIGTRGSAGILVTNTL